LIRAIRSLATIVAIAGVSSISVQPVVAFARTPDTPRKATVKLFDRNGKEIARTKSATINIPRTLSSFDSGRAVAELQLRIVGLKSREKPDPERIDRYERWVRFLQATTLRERRAALSSASRVHVERETTSDGWQVIRMANRGGISIELSVPTPLGTTPAEHAGGPSADENGLVDCYENNEPVECASTQDLEDLAYLAAEGLAESEILEAETQTHEGSCLGYNGCYDEDDAFVVSGPAAGNPEFASCRAKLMAAFIATASAAGWAFALLDAIGAALGPAAGMSIAAALGWSFSGVALITSMGVAAAMAAVCVVYWFQVDLMMPHRQTAIAAI